MREQHGTPSFNPQLPTASADWPSLSTLQQRRLRIEITPSTTTYHLRNGQSLEIRHNGEPATVSTGIPLRLPTHQAPQLPTSNPPPQPRTATTRVSHEDRELK